MEERLLKLTAQLGFVAVLIWILAGLLGKRDQVAVKPQSRQRSWQQANSNVNYSQPVTVSPRAEGTNFFSPPLAPLTRY